jgi:hypothetical protein
MAKLTDLAPITRAVTVRGISLTVFPLSLGKLAEIADRFGSRSVEEIMLGDSDMILATVAAALRTDAESVRTYLYPTEQAEILTVAIEISMPADTDEAPKGEAPAQA